MKLKELKNEYGNVQKKDFVGKPEFAHVGGQRRQQLCNRIGIEFVPCVDGFKRSGGRYNPVPDGVVIYTADLGKMKTEIENYGERNSSEVREKRRLAREIKYQKEQKQFALEIRKQFPSMPKGEECDIARRACEVGSGRVGRSTTADDAIYPAVFAHIRHTYTDYDDLREDLKSEGFDNEDSRDEARILIKSRIREILNDWKKSVA